MEKVLTTVPTADSLSSTRARAREASELAGLYQHYVGAMTPYIAGEIAGALQRGLTREQLEYAITETGMAPRPSWRYCAAILRRLEHTRSAGGGIDRGCGGKEGSNLPHPKNEREYDDAFFEPFFNQFR